MHSFIMSFGCRRSELDGEM